MKNKIVILNSEQKNYQDDKLLKLSSLFVYSGWWCFDTKLLIHR